MIDQLAPALQTCQWFNQDQALSLEDLRGKVVVLHAFQILCPGCVSHGVPQAERVHRFFPRNKVQVLGLHTVFEHHAVMTPPALAVFLHEYRVTHPVAVDLPVAGQAIPATMQAYNMQGTPSLMLIDQEGRLVLQEFGIVEDMRLGALIGQLLN